MWIALAAVWILGSVTLYAYLVSSAGEPRMDQCLDCYLPDCHDCPFPADSSNLLDPAA